MEVILIRHTSVDVPKGTCYGHTDVPVAATFEQEAEVTRQNLAQYLPFDAVYYYSYIYTCPSMPSMPRHSPVPACSPATAAIPSHGSTTA